MSDHLLDPNVVPNQNIDGAGRRMTKNPIVIATLIIGIFLALLMYAVMQRGNHTVDNTIKTNDGKSVYEPVSTESAENKINSFKPLARKVVLPAALPEDNNPPNPTPLATDFPASAPPLRNNIQSKEHEQSLKLIQQFRFDTKYDAITGDTSVQVPTQRSDTIRSNGNQAGNPINYEDEKKRRMQQVQQISEKGMTDKQWILGNLLSLQLVTGAAQNQNTVDVKQLYKETVKKYGYSSEFRRPQLTPYELAVGSINPSTLITGINSDIPGEVLAQVRQNVRDSRTGQHILIPQGSRLIGTYDSQVTMGQKRLLIGWHRIEFPGGSKLNLGTMSGADSAGQAGFFDKVDNHYRQIFGNATLLSFIGAGAQLSQPQSDNRTLGGLLRGRSENSMQKWVLKW
jgi:type IV secretory pathway VirB10-like protein